MNKMRVKALETEAAKYYNDEEDIVRAIRAFFDFAVTFVNMFMNVEMVQKLAEASLMGKVFAGATLKDGNEIEVPSYDSFVKRLISFIKAFSWDDQETAKMWLDAAVGEDNRMEAKRLHRSKKVITKDGHEVTIDLFCGTNTDEYGDNEYSLLYVTATVKGRYKYYVLRFGIDAKGRAEALKAFEKMCKDAENSRSVDCGSSCYVEAFDPEWYPRFAET